jgi:hypothetical protein
MYIYRSNTGVGSHPSYLLGEPASSSPVFSKAEQAAAQDLINKGAHNENALTDTIFFRRHPRPRDAALSLSEKKEWIVIRDRLVRPSLAAVPMAIPFRPCCIFGPSPAKFTDITKLGAHKEPSEELGIVYTGRAGFIDLGHLRETCDITEFVWTRLQGSGGAPSQIPTPQGEAKIIKAIPPDRWLNVAQAIANDDALGHEIWTYDVHSLGMHHSAFSPEDLCSNFIGTVVARLAIGDGGVFARKVDARLASVLKGLLAQTPAETEKAFNKVKTRWVNFVDSDSWKKDDYLRRRNFTRRPFKAGHPSDALTPSWVVAGFGDAETYYTYKNTAVRTIHKKDFATEIQRIRADAKARYGNDFDKP